MMKIFRKKKEIIQVRINILPNCSLCDWARPMLSAENKVVGKICEAQGAVNCSTVYNNEMCLKLYPKKEAQCETV